MTSHPLTPVFVGLRTGLHALVATLLGLVVVRLVVEGASLRWLGLLLVVVFAGTYVLGARVSAVRPARRRPFGAVWLAALGIVWVGLLAIEPEAAYLAFPLFFLCLHVLPGASGPVAVVATTAIAIVALGLPDGFTVGGVVGPIVGAGVALLIGLGYRALAREAAERERLLAELVATRDQLAATEREQGVLAERSRLAREIHDTVAQSLSSIQMLLHAAERATPDQAGVEHVQLARETAADALAEARRFIRELSPPSLDDGLTTALERLGATQSSATGLVVTVDAAGAADLADLPMPLQTALLRIAQGALANVVQHARATSAHVVLATGADVVTLTVADNGVGFDPAAVRSRPASSDSFGLRAIEERVHQLDGTLEVGPSPGANAGDGASAGDGAGTTVAVTLPWRRP